MTDHTLRPMTESDLEQVLQWRNHLEVRSYMYTTHEIRVEEHRKWFMNASPDPAIELLIYEQGGKAQGFVNIARTRCPEVADWGFYLAPNALKGSGRELGKQALNYAFGRLRLHKVCGQALGFNERSITFHKRLGFVEEARLRDQHFNGSQFHDVVCFGLLNSEWQAQTKD
ncbi:UDP-4-amino-4,6-dideoxy-N-acetyl-beta-L-altrosamine N-acetyltransferase [Marinobacter flavimaris]|uniref:UDP-4-amino-4, 6-dideoxy-N-acetyl-beta-L-altrosamine N-acetyltransferase n=1 Tax=Marinobacter flavimaris TaxID=262076 RepID=UPI003868CA13